MLCDLGGLEILSRWFGPVFVAQFDVREGLSLPNYSFRTALDLIRKVVRCTWSVERQSKGSWKLNGRRAFIESLLKLLYCKIAYGTPLRQIVCGVLHLLSAVDVACAEHLFRCLLAQLLSELKAHALPRAAPGVEELPPRISPTSLFSLASLLSSEGDESLFDENLHGSPYSSFGLGSADEADRSPSMNVEGLACDSPRPDAAQVVAQLGMHRMMPSTPPDILFLICNACVNVLKFSMSAENVKQAVSAAAQCAMLMVAQVHDSAVAPLDRRDAHAQVAKLFRTLHATVDFEAALIQVRSVREHTRASEWSHACTCPTERAEVCCAVMCACVVASRLVVMGPGCPPNCVFSRCAGC
jgi:hypothetical protein